MISNLRFGGVYVGGRVMTCYEVLRWNPNESHNGDKAGVIRGRFLLMCHAKLLLDRKPSQNHLRMWPGESETTRDFAVPNVSFRPMSDQRRKNKSNSLEYHFSAVWCEILRITIMTYKCDGIKKGNHSRVPPILYSPNQSISAWKPQSLRGPVVDLPISSPGFAHIQ